MDMAIKYMASWGWRDEIRAIDVERETESSIWYEGRRHPKAAQSTTYHDTWGEAHAHLMSKAADEIEQASKALNRAKSRAGVIRGLKPAPTHRSG